MVKYPNRMTPHRVSLSHQETNFANRGMSFESEINASNQFYLKRGIAVVHKKPTPVQIVKVDYPKRSRAKIVEAYFRQASTTDYSGVYKGYYIDFEAKETRQKTAFPMKNFHQHQIDHMKQVLEQAGICFVLLHLSALNQVYLMSARHLITFYEDGQGKKSMPFDYIKKYSFELPRHQFPSIPYIDIIEKEFIKK